MVSKNNTALLRLFTAAKMAREERGQDLLEYALLGGFIALGIVLGFVLFDDAVTDMVAGIGNCIDFTDATTCDPGP
jgi:Flp pilus assembly pilin Flp